MFNAMLPKGMPFYNMPLRSRDLAEVISDCYEILGRRATIDLLGHMNRIGFRQSTTSGLSFATDDLITPPNKQKIIPSAERGVMQDPKALPARHHHRGRTLQPGARRLDPRPRADHHGNDGRVGERPPLPPRTSATSTRSSSWPTPAPAAASSRFASWPACAV